MPKHQTTREHVYKTIVPRGMQLLCSPLSWCLNKTPAQVVPRNSNKFARPRPGLGVWGWSILVVLFTTTLGNGYLGSRIDEERSEMRYLV